MSALDRMVIRMIKKRYTISKEIADNLQFQGWKLIETVFDKDYGTNIYHLEKEEVEENK